MAKKISQLTQATQVKSDDVTVIVQDGETKKLPLNMMVTKQEIEDKKVAGLAKLDEIEATYENDTYTPTITVKNKSSVKVGEGDGVDYSANVMDGHAKSAILTGQTLVNLVTTDTSIGYTLTQDGEYIKKKTLELIDGFDAKTYTFICELSDVNIVNPSGTWVVYISTLSLSDNAADNTSIKSYIKNGKVVFTYTPSRKTKTINNFSICLHTDSGVGSSITISNVVVLDGDYTNVDIPYFTGMQSVKMPVLTTTGKNLFDGITFKKWWVNAVEGVQKVETGANKSIIVNVKPNTKYKLSGDGITRGAYAFLNANFEEIKRGGSTTGTRETEESPSGSKYLLWYLHNEDISNCSNIQVEEGSTVTSYEPYKSNILTVNEDVTLRGIEDVRDTLDLLTGEVTQRIGEIVLDGSENWVKPSSQPTNTSRFLLLDFPNNKNAKTLSNIRVKQNAGEDEIGIWCDTNTVLNVDTSVDTVESLKVFLSKNPINLQYSLATESIKTVDLIPSGTHPSTTPYCWKDGHIQLSSSGLLPSLEYSVVTSRAGQISQNAAMIVKNDKRIFDLEILLAGGLVNTTYQALTLQNQVETGLSKVSLSSEKEPDYLLYHMIMKLIEEKAYKLDDLTEKVSVFYLYEKLSDEQFETIYSELYPFVEEEYIELPEDGEIIEEPIVDEVLEEVENGVAM